jgi:hypothetical protein
MAQRSSGEEMKQDNRVKIEVSVEPETGLNIKTESLWAESLGHGLYRILNSPFFAFGISAEDVVRAEGAKEPFTFREVVDQGGHSTYRIFLKHGKRIDSSDFRQYWAPIKALGATFENANDRFIAIDIPPGADVAGIYKLFQRGEEDGIWEFEEVYYAGGE